ncbi:MAG: HAMP domain-containing sensor histidine kinase [Candidatus Dactylopiibacterium sp.]|nr:HAMP domain-containing sensor histidine kinase [Candidatus Dactylopiibacterium sp.]
MGRLFWKLFLAIFLAQLFTAWGVGVLFWMTRGEVVHHAPPRAATSEPRPEAGRWPPAPHASPADATRPFPPRQDEPRLPPGPRFPWPPVAVGFFASLLVAGLLARHLSRPIVGLRRAFEDVAAGNFAPAKAPRRRIWPDEISDLTLDFQRTAEQIRMLIGNQRRLLHDVSHEVRSPLARMQLAIDLAHQQPARASESMARVERESARINHLVEELLTLSRLEAGGWERLEEPLELGELLQELAEDARFEAAARQSRVTLHADDAAPVRGNAMLLQRAIENVVRNAIRHGAAGGHVRLSLRRIGPAWRIRVEDDGPGVPDARLDEIFDPFVRVDASPDAEGYGLGLAITRQTLEAHGGHVQASNRAEGGLCVDLWVPAAAAASAQTP